MTITIRPFAPTHAEAVFDLRVRTFTSASTVPYDPDELYIPDEDRFVALDGDDLVGHLGIWPFAQTMGGRRVPMGGVAAVIVEATHRRRGIASRLLAAAFAHLRATGRPISTLYPATVAPYRRAGYEIAGVRVRRTVPTRALTALPRPADDVTVRAAVPDDLPALVRIHDEVTALEPGGLGATDRWLRRNLTPDPDDGDVVHVAVRDGAPLGFVHHERGAASDGHGAWTAVVHRLVGADRDAELALWHLIGSSWSVAPTTRFVSRPAEPLLLDLPENDLSNDEHPEHWMTRLVDVAGAIAERGFPPGLRVAVPLTVHDDVIPGNDGAAVLEIDDGRGRLSPGGSGEVAVDVRDLAALYTGFLSASTLKRRGRLTGAPEHVAALDAAFAGATPFLRDYF